MNDLFQTIRKIEDACFEKPWSDTAIKLSLRNDSAICFAEEWGYVIGIGLCGEYELYRIAVMPQFRGKKLSVSLMELFLEKCGGNVFLEVEAENIPALSLYKKFGFKEISRRNDYYGAGRHCVNMKLERNNENNQRFTKRDSRA